MVGSVGGRRRRRRPQCRRRLSRREWGQWEVTAAVVAVLLLAYPQRTPARLPPCLHPQEEREEVERPQLLRRLTQATSQACRRSHP